MSRPVPLILAQGLEEVGVLAFTFGGLLGGHTEQRLLMVVVGLAMFALGANIERRTS